MALANLMTPRPLIRQLKNIIDNTRAGHDFHEIKTVLMASTGKAAYNMKENIIHGALDSSWLNTLRCYLNVVKLVFLMKYLW